MGEVSDSIEVGGLEWSLRLAIDVQIVGVVPLVKHHLLVRCNVLLLGGRH